ncbi:MAG: LysR family transcriptional regulator [gamma proteobacterium endosymbiont of Lamellibrachia anaximandri]|nr:LysR family transcriptional regulator [gamma proteobacterium endosymbiont of Lamellibrachia anaximandri]MBL3534555.1 LysR family transcriptional regulator [gamma proteobacterium endosymbiont of Lamellibrachia anaximandri]
MNLRDLKYVVAVADSSHFGHAAERCYVSQPTLSGQIKKLEDELGITLFERTKRSVAITPVGETIVAHAREILEQAETIRQLAQSHQDPLVGPLRIGAIMTLSPYLMPLILKPLRERLPQMRLVISEEMTETLLERLRKHEIDAALIATPVDTSEFATIPLFDEPFWLAHPRNHPFQEKKAITQKDLDNTELLLLSEGHCLADQAMEVCHMKARAEQGDMADLHAASLETLLQLVGVGFGCTLVPDLAVRGIRMNDKDIVTRRLQQKDAFRRVYPAFRRSFPRRQALDAFIEVLLDNLPDTVFRLS